jgi:amidohydrolase
MDRKYFEMLVKIRRDLHKIAEIGFEEKETKQYIRDFAAKLNCLTIEAGGGIVLFFNLKRPDTYAFRAELDALNIVEKTNKTYKSTTPFMHACGHDGHMAMCLCLAQYVDDCLKKSASSFYRNIAIIFQPAEELTGGAKSVIKSGVLQQLNLYAVFALHLMPDYKFGKIFSTANTVMAGSNEVDVLFFGQAAHIAKKRVEGVVLDALTAFYQATIKYNEKIKKGFLRFGLIEGGTMRNVLSGTACLKGTMRYFDEIVQHSLISFAENCAKDISAKTGVKIDINIKEGNAPVKNDPTLFSKCKKAFDLQTTEPLWLSDDFCFFGSLCPILYCFLGLGKNENLHSPHFDFNEAVLVHGLDYFMSILNLI